MALFNFFGWRRQECGKQRTNVGENQRMPSCRLQDPWETTRLNLPPLRLLVFRENEWKERRLMFDSESFPSCKRSSAKESSCSPLKTNAWSRSSRNVTTLNLAVEDEEASSFTKSKAKDVKFIAELMFGSIGSNNKEDTIKLHTLNNSTQIMLTNVFRLLPKKRRPSHQIIQEGCELDQSPKSPFTFHRESDSDSQYSTINSIESFLISANQSSKSSNIHIPRSNSGQEKVTQLCFNSKPNHNSISPEYCINSSPNHSSSNPTPITASWKSLQLTYLTNSLENVRRRDYSCSTVGGISDEDETTGSVCYRSRAQIGISVIFSSGGGENGEDTLAENFRRFFFCHIQLIESEIMRLKFKVAEICHLKKLEFLSAICQIWLEFTTDLGILYETPRFRHPVWYCLSGRYFKNQERLRTSVKTCSKYLNKNDNSLNLNSLTKRKFLTDDYAKTENFNETQFVDVFCDLASTLDTKETNFFLSTILTTFLTLHSSWVSSVHNVGRSSDISFHHVKMNSYYKTASSTVNALIAQLVDLWSVFNSDHHSLRTFFLSQDEDLLAKLVYVLTYFLRCTPLKRSKRFDQQYDDAKCADKNSVGSRLKKKIIERSSSSIFVSDLNHSLEAETNLTNQTSLLCGSENEKLSAFLYDKIENHPSIDDHGESIDSAVTFIEESIDDRRRRCSETIDGQINYCLNEKMDSNDHRLINDDERNGDRRDSYLESDVITRGSLHPILPTSSSQDNDDWLKKNLKTFFASTKLETLDDETYALSTDEPVKNPSCCSSSLSYDSNFKNDIIDGNLKKNFDASANFSQKDLSKKVAVLEIDDDDDDNLLLKNSERQHSSFLPAARFGDPGYSLQACLQKFDLNSSDPQRRTISGHFALNAIQLLSKPLSSRSLLLRKSSFPFMGSAELQRRRSLLNNQQHPSCAYTVGNNNNNGEVVIAEDCDDVVKTALRDTLIKTAAIGDSMSIDLVYFLVADCRNWSVSLLSCDTYSLAHINVHDLENVDKRYSSNKMAEISCFPSRTVLDMVENVKILRATNCDAEFIIMYIEDWLSEIYQKGVALVNLLELGCTQCRQSPAFCEALKILGADPSDAAVLLSVCAF